MKKYNSMCIDNKTRKRIILSGGNYNHTAFWLQQELLKYDMEIYRTEKHISGLFYWFAGKFDEKNKAYTDLKMFYYDEERELLLGD